jgi:hypothetical protein
MSQRSSGGCPVCSGQLAGTAIRLDPGLNPRQQIQCLDCDTIFAVLISPPDPRSPSIWMVALSALRYTRRSR